MLRFPSFKEDWAENTLEAISEKVTSGSRDWAQYYSEQGALFVRMTNLPKTGIDLLLNDLKFVDLPKSGSEGERTALKPNDILISITAELGKIGLIPEDIGEAYINQHTALVRPRSDTVSPHFVAQYLAAFKSNKRLNRLNDSGAKSGLNLSTVKGFRIKLPSLAEQMKIADFLGAVDRKLAALREKEAALTRFKRGLMQALFSQTLRFKRDDGSSYPDWEEKRLGDVFEEVTEKVGDSDLPTYSISAGKGWVSQKEKFGKDISGDQNERYTALGVGEFSYNKGNSKSYKYGCIYPNDTNEVIAVPNVFISFRRITEETSIGFYAKLFESHHLDRGLRRLISSGARMDGLLNVNKGQFFKLKVPAPLPEEQQKISNALSAMDAKIAAVSNQITKLDAFKKGLLQQMFV
nr:restriction endonuclease subunit S [uncultured Hyphomonas sp.]